MKKTKLLTTLAAFVLVLGLGACDTTEEEETTGNEDTGVVSSDTDTDTEPEDEPAEEVSTEGAYALVGDFVDSDWNEFPDTSSIYFIPADTEKYEVTVTIASEPVDNEWWTDTNHWDAGLRVVNYGTWDLAVGSSQLDASSTGAKVGSSDNNIAVSWNATYDIVITFGDTNSILVTQVTE